MHQKAYNEFLEHISIPDKPGVEDSYSLVELAQRDKISVFRAVCSQPASPCCSLLHPPLASQTEMNTNGRRT